MAFLNLMTLKRHLIWVQTEAKRERGQIWSELILFCWIIVFCVAKKPLRWQIWKKTEIKGNRRICCASKTALISRINHVMPIDGHISINTNIADFVRNPFPSSTDRTQSPLVRCASAMDMKKYISDYWISIRAHQSLSTSSQKKLIRINRWVSFASFTFSIRGWVLFVPSFLKVLPSESFECISSILDWIDTNIFHLV